MKWQQAIKKIEKAFYGGAYSVSVYYRPKYSRNSNDHRYGDVVDIIEYEYNGETCKAINIKGDQLNEGSHTIDEIYVDYFFNIGGLEHLNAE